MLQLQESAAHHRASIHGNASVSKYESGGSSARKAGNRKTGVMGKGKFHHRRGQDDDPHSVLALDADGPYRTHLLFPGKRDEAEGEGGPRKPGSASFMKQMLGWGKKSSSRSTPPSESRPPSLDPSDPYSRGKQVSFLGDYDGRLLFERPDRRPNSYNCDPNPTNPDRYFRAFNDPFRESDRGPGPSTPGGPAPAPRTRGAQPSEPMSGVGRGVSGLVAAVGGQVAAAATGGKMTRNTDTYYSNGGGPPKVDPSGRNRGVRPKRMSARDDKREPLPRDLKDVSKDCFIIPQENLERFLPDGITLPREPRRNQIINILEVSNPQLTITFHLMGPLSPTTPQYDTPSNESAAPLELQREVAMQALAEACKLGATEGFLLKNLEKDSEYPYINYYVINKPQAASEEFFRATRSRAYDILNPGRVGYRCHHSIDLFEEAVSIARPPVEPLSKKPVSANTGYIVCVYQVFSGDDGEKFERNWLFWTGARMLYKNLPKAVGLRRITLHKSCSQSSQSKVTYLLLVECSEFMGHIGEAANLLPILRGRICGYTGIYRVASSF
ncbi:uncharacterized protein LOC131878543 isoform X2 [Tigriopus californicus]|uniref:uncharacterized protein LOC131878543 isoform X2 n=1 Tax=Tigriopus californicus TaxID=6832 RepID=UPI0027D9E5D2|nr:uncharacterized protein LOC131878543 isoform X2 [Tigriopus californicus]